MARDDGWMKEAACRDSDVNFFPPRGSDSMAYLEQARALCNGCPVRLTCLRFAIAHRIHWGVWGGLSAHQRRRLPVHVKQQVREAWFIRHPLANPLSPTHSFGRTG